MTESQHGRPVPPASPAAPGWLDDRLTRVRSQVEPGLEQRFLDGVANPTAVLALAETGLLGLTIPGPLGGLGQDYRALGEACAGLGRIDLSLQITVTVHLALTAMTILQWGTESQQRRWLPALASGAEIGTFALTEPGAGSDVAALRTRATACAGGFRLHGEKTWISGANDSSLLIIFATTDPAIRHHGISAFVVPRPSPGLSTPELHGKLGIRAGDTASVVLADVFVPAGNILGRPGEGFPIALSALALGLFTVGYGALGITRECLSLVTALLRDSDGRHHPKPSQVWRGRIAEMVSYEARASVLLNRAADLKNRGLPSQQATSLAKWTAASGAVGTAEAALQLAQERRSASLAAFERHLRNAKGAVIYGGTNEIHQVMQSAYATGDRLDRPFRRPAPTAADLVGAGPD